MKSVKSNALSFILALVAIEVFLARDTVEAFSIDTRVPKKLPTTSLSFSATSDYMGSLSAGMSENYYAAHSPSMFEYSNTMDNIGEDSMTAAAQIANEPVQQIRALGSSNHDPNIDSLLSMLDDISTSFSSSELMDLDITNNYGERIDLTSFVADLSSILSSSGESMNTAFDDPSVRLNELAGQTIDSLYSVLVQGNSIPPLQPFESNWETVSTAQAPGYFGAGSEPSVMVFEETIPVDYILQFQESAGVLGSSIQSGADQTFSGIGNYFEQSASATQQGISNFQTSIKAQTDNVLGGMGSFVEDRLSSTQQALKIGTDQTINGISKSMGPAQVVFEQSAAVTKQALSDFQASMSVITDALTKFLDLTMSILLAVSRAMLEGITSQPAEEVLAPVISAIQCAKSEIIAFAVASMKEMSEMTFTEMVSVITAFMKTVIVLFIGVLRLLVETVGGAPINEVLSSASSALSQWDVSGISHALIAFPTQVLIVLLSVLRAFVGAVSGETSVELLERACASVVLFLEESLPLLTENFILLLQELTRLMLESGSTIFQVLG